MDYNHISDFLKKFKQTLFKSEEYYDVISMIITKHISSPFDKSKIKIKGSTIYIKASPILRNEILIHKRGILDDISNLVTDRKFTDIN